MSACELAELFYTTVPAVNGAIKTILKGNEYQGNEFFYKVVAKRIRKAAKLLCYRYAVAVLSLNGSNAVATR